MGVTARKSSAGPPAITNDLARTVALVSMTNATSQSFSFALNPVSGGPGANPGDMVDVHPRTSFSGISVNARGFISANNVVTVVVTNSDAASIAAQTATIDTYVFAQ